MKTISREEFENRTYLERVRRIQDLNSILSVILI